MRTRNSIAHLLALGALVAMLLGCGAAPAAQVAEPPPETQKAMPDSQKPAPDASANGSSAVAAVEVGHQVGQRAPDFGMSLLDGSRVTTSSIVDEGKPVLLYFHATY